VLERAIAAQGKPQSIRSDNGPELTPRHYLAWAIEWKIDLVHIQPGKPTQNGGMESFNGKLRDECLNTSWFWNLFDARKKISAWKTEYNSRRPHSSLAYRTPDEFARQWKAAPGDPFWGTDLRAGIISSNCQVFRVENSPTQIQPIQEAP
jgi:putative transposase